MCVVLMVLWFGWGIATRTNVVRKHHHHYLNINFNINLHRFDIHKIFYTKKFNIDFEPSYVAQSCNQVPNVFEKYLSFLIRTISLIHIKRMQKLVLCKEKNNCKSEINSFLTYSITQRFTRSWNFIVKEITYNFVWCNWKQFFASEIENYLS